MFVELSWCCNGGIEKKIHSAWHQMQLMGSVTRTKAIACLSLCLSLGREPLFSPSLCIKMERQPVTENKEKEKKRRETEATNTRDARNGHTYRKRRSISQWLQHWTTGARLPMVEGWRLKSCCGERTGFLHPNVDFEGNTCGRTFREF